MRNELPNGKPKNDGPARGRKPTTYDAVGVDVTAPLQWWRTLPPQAFSERRVEALTAVLSRLSIFGEALWPAAAAGDATAAMGVALRLSKGMEQPTAIVNIAATALLRPALAGSPAAVLVLASIIRRLVRGPGGRRLAKAWLAYGDLLLNEPRRRSRGTTLQHD